MAGSNSQRPDGIELADSELIDYVDEAYDSSYLKTTTTSTPATTTTTTTTRTTRQPPRRRTTSSLPIPHNSPPMSITTFPMTTMAKNATSTTSTPSAEQNNLPSNQMTTSATIRPKIVTAMWNETMTAPTMMPAKLTATTTELIGSGTTTGQPQSAYQLYGIIQSAIQSVYALKDSLFLNRTTRLAPQSESHANKSATSDPETEEDPEEIAVSLGKLTLDNGVGGTDNKSTGGLGKFATQEDIHLLCKLLHKQLEKSANSTSSSIASSSPKPPGDYNDDNDITSEPTGVTSTTAQGKGSRVSKTSTTTQSPLDSVATTTTKAVRKLVPPGGTGKDGNDSRLILTDNSEELGEMHESYLLESIFGYDLATRRSRNESLVVSGQRIMLNLFNIAHRIRQQGRKKVTIAPTSESDSKLEPTSTQAPSEAPQDDDTDEPMTSTASYLDNSMASAEDDQSQAQVQSQNFLRLVTQRRATRASKGKLNLVYWLLEPVEAPVSKSARDRGNKRLRFKLLNLKQAESLLDSLEHNLIQRQLDASNMTSLVLISSYAANKNNSSGNDNQINTPKVIDDSFKQKDSGISQQQSSAFQMLVDRFKHPNFSDNLQFFLIIFLVILFVIILCATVPMICKKWNGKSTRLASGITRGGGTGKGNGGAKNRKRVIKRRSKNQQDTYDDSSGTFRREALEGALRGTHGSLMHGSNLKSDYPQSPVGDEFRSHNLEQVNGSNDSIWRKLSSTTTTLVNDETRELHNEGTMRVPISRTPVGRNLSTQDLIGEIDGGQQGSGNFEWYTYEDKLERQERCTKTIGQSESETYVISDRRHLTKSVQTNQQRPSPSPPLGSSDPNDSRQQKHQVARVTNDTPDFDSTMPIGFSRRQSSKNSDTLTKSELVMLKEKLIPFRHSGGQAGDFDTAQKVRNQSAVEQQSQQQPPSPPRRQQVASQTSDPVYVNQSAQVGRSVFSLAANQESQKRSNSSQDSQSQPAAQINPPEMATSGGYGNSSGRRPLDLSVNSFIDSGESYHSNVAPDVGSQSSQIAAGSSRQQDQRVPRMQHLELPPRTRSKVEEIKQELGKLERRGGGDSSARFI